MVKEITILTNRPSIKAIASPDILPQNLYPNIDNKLIIILEPFSRPSIKAIASPDIFPQNLYPNIDIN